MSSSASHMIPGGTSFSLNATILAAYISQGMSLIIVLFVLLLLRWTVLRGFWAIVAQLPAADWITPLALWAAGFAAFKNFGWFLAVSAVSYIAGIVATIALMPVLLPLVAFLSPAMNNALRPKNEFQVCCVNESISILFYAGAEYLVLLAADKLLPGFAMKSFTLDLFGLLVLLVVFNRLSSLANRPYGNGSRRLTFGEMWKGSPSSFPQAASLP